MAQGFQDLNMFTEIQGNSMTVFISYYICIKQALFKYITQLICQFLTGAAATLPKGNRHDTTLSKSMQTAKRRWKGQIVKPTVVLTEHFTNNNRDQNFHSLVALRPSFLIFTSVAAHSAFPFNRPPHLRLIRCWTLCLIITASLVSVLCHFEKWQKENTDLSLF